MANQQKMVVEGYNLKTENEKLKAQVKETELKYMKACKAYYDMKAKAESKDKVIERLERKILSLVNAYV